MNYSVPKGGHSDLAVKASPASSVRKSHCFFSWFSQLTFIKKYYIIYIENKRNKEVYQMNDNANYILELLRSGMSVDDIAKQMSDALNEASIAHKAEEEAKREAEEKAKLAAEEKAKREERKEYLAGEVARTMKDYIDEFHPSLGDKVSVEGFKDSFIKSVDAMIEFEKRIASMDFDNLDWLDEFFGK